MRTRTYSCFQMHIVKSFTSITEVQVYRHFVFLSLYWYDYKWTTAVKLVSVQSLDFFWGSSDSRKRCEAPPWPVTLPQSPVSTGTLNAEDPPQFSCPPVPRQHRILLGLPTVLELSFLGTLVPCCFLSGGSFLLGLHSSLVPSPC